MNQLVRIGTSRRSPGEVVISWDARQELLQRLNGAEHASIVAVFTAVGTSRRVHLTLGEKRLLLAAIEQWREDAKSDLRLPVGIIDLRHALEQDLHVAGGY